MSGAPSLMRDVRWHSLQQAIKEECFMHNSCKVSTFSAVLLAVAQEDMPQSQIPFRIRGLFDAVYSWARSAPVRQVGHNYAIYEKGVNADLLVRAGFPVSGPFPDFGPVKCLELCGGGVAHITHVGPYTELRRSYAALEGWCHKQGITLGGQSWEVYGDWQEDQSKLETEIYFRLRAA
jgi:hypothetical protein